MKLAKKILNQMVDNDADLDTQLAVIRLAATDAGNAGMIYRNELVPFLGFCLHVLVDVMKEATSTKKSA